MATGQKNLILFRKEIDLMLSSTPPNLMELGNTPMEIAPLDAIEGNNPIDLKTLKAGITRLANKFNGETNPTQHGLAPMKMKLIGMKPTLTGMELNLTGMELALTGMEPLPIEAMKIDLPLQNQNKMKIFNLSPGLSLATMLRLHKDLREPIEKGEDR